MTFFREYYSAKPKAKRKGERLEGEDGGTESDRPRKRGNEARSGLPDSGRIVCCSTPRSDLFGVAIHAINNVVPSYSLFYLGGCSGWNFALASLHGLHRPEWNCIDGPAQKDTDLKVDFISERACENAPHTIPQNHCFPSSQRCRRSDALTISSSRLSRSVVHRRKSLVRPTDL